jgi:transposase
MGKSMPRKRRQQIVESLGFLQEMERRYVGMPQFVRIRALRCMKEDPSLTLNEICARVGCSEGSVKRWWRSYQMGGIQEVLRDGDRGRKSRLGREELATLAAKVRSGELLSSHAIRKWLLEHYGLQYSREGIRQLMRTALHAKRQTGWTMPSEQYEGSLSHMTEFAADASTIPTTILLFLNSLPLRLKPQAWISEFRDALLRLLGDVDRMSISINTHCDLLDPHDYKPDLIISHNIAASAGTVGSVTVVPYELNEHSSDRILADLRRQGHSLDLYHEPHSFTYHYAGNAYLGTIFLWRLSAKQPISQQTIQTMVSLEPFIIFALSDLITRFHYAFPINNAFYNALVHMAKEARLTLLEKQAVSYRLNGLRYKEIASEMGKSEDAIRKYIASVHRKTNTRSLPEVFAKYFTPRLGLDNLPDQ